MNPKNIITNGKVMATTHYTKESIMALIPQSVKDNFEVLHHPESNHFQFLYSKGGGLASTFFPISKLISIDNNETTIEFNTNIFKVMVFKNIPCIHTIIYND
jgi:hypothetical protein